MRIKILKLTLIFVLFLRLSSFASELICVTDISERKTYRFTVLMSYNEETRVSHLENVNESFDSKLGYFDGFFRIERNCLSSKEDEPCMIEYYLKKFSLYDQKTDDHWEINDTYLAANYTRNQLEVSSLEISDLESDVKEILSEYLFNPCGGYEIYAPKTDEGIGQVSDVSDLLKNEFREGLEEGLSLNDFSATVIMRGRYKSEDKNYLVLDMNLSAPNLKSEVDGDNLEGSIYSKSSGDFCEDATFMKYHDHTEFRIKNIKKSDTDPSISIFRFRDSFTVIELTEKDVFEGLSKGSNQ